MFLSCFGGQNGSQFFSKVSQNTVEPSFTTTINMGQSLALHLFRYSDKTAAVSQNVFAVSKVKP